MPEQKKTKKTVENDIDTDLRNLYASVRRHKVECPHCHNELEVGGDFAEMKTVMELRLKHEANLLRKGDDGETGDVPAGLRD